jgi:prephenate dehydrogenase
MAIQVTIVGLGQIGGSIGLALGQHEKTFLRLGHDLDASITQKAKKIGAIDRTMFNLPSAIREADVVILSLPMDQIRATLQVIAQDLKDQAVVLDTGPVKEAVAAWAGELLPTGRYYVGLTPVINPAYLHALDRGLDAARPDLFNHGLLAIASPAGTASEAIKLAADLARLLGAAPLFVDPLEIDSLMAATHILPQLVAAALLNATVDQPGWHEARKIAGRAYAEVTGITAQMDDADPLLTSAILSRDNVIRSMDGLIASLQAMRNDLAQGDAQALQGRLRRAFHGRNEWWKQRQSANWEEAQSTSEVKTSASSEIFGRLLGIRRRTKPKA